jgi:hypothetical protein
MAVRWRPAAAFEAIHRPRETHRMKSELLPRLTSMLAVWAVLLAWQVAALQIGDWAIPFFLAVLAIPISLAGAERSF